MSTDDTVSAQEQRNQDIARGQTHWETDAEGRVSKVQNTQVMNNDQQLRNDRQKFAQSLPIDKLAQYKEALVSGDPADMAKFREGLTPGQTKLLNEIQTRDPVSMMRGTANMMVNLAYMTGAIELAQGAAPGFGQFMSGLLDPRTNLLSMSNLTPAADMSPGFNPNATIKAPGLATPGFAPDEFRPKFGLEM